MLPDILQYILIWNKNFETWVPYRNNPYLQIQSVTSGNLYMKSHGVIYSAPSIGMVWSFIGHSTVSYINITPQVKMLYSAWLSVRERSICRPPWQMFTRWHSKTNVWWNLYLNTSGTRHLWNLAMSSSYSWVFPH